MKRSHVQKPADGAGYGLYITGDGHAVAGLLYGPGGTEITGAQHAAAHAGEPQAHSLGNSFRFSQIGLRSGSRRGATSDSSHYCVHATAQSRVSNFFPAVASFCYPWRTQRAHGPETPTGHVRLRETTNAVDPFRRIACPLCSE